jgi:hypothetical protein
MSESAITDWDRIVHKGVRSKDNQDIGNVISIENDSITVHQGARHEYIISKSDVEGYNGSEVFLKSNYNDLRRQEIKT